MKANKKGTKLAIVLSIILALTFSIQMISVGAQEGENPDGPIIPTELSIEYTAPTAGQNVAEVNKTFKSDYTTLQFQNIEWKDFNDAVLTDDSTFTSNEEYTLTLALTVDGGYVTKSTAVKLNGQEMVYQEEPDKSATGESTEESVANIGALFSIAVEPQHMKAPEATFNATGIDSGILGNVTSSMQYSTDGASWIKCGDGEIQLIGLSEGEILVAYTADAYNKQHILVSRQNAPTGINAVNCSTKDNKDGKITGVNASMEYCIAGEKSYKKCTGKEITGLVPGKYAVRTIAAGTKLSSGDVVLTVAKYSDNVPEIIQQPKNITVETGNDCKMTIKAKNAKKYEWHVIDVVTGKDFVLDPKEDKKYYKGFGTDTITILSVNKQKEKENDCKYDGDKYYCVVSNDVGKVTSKIAKYNVKHVAEGDWIFNDTQHWQKCSCGTIINAAAHVDKKNTGKCEVCGCELKAETKDIKIISGANATWHAGGTEGLVITIDEDLKSFVKLLIDDDVVAEDEYSLESGSTIITLEPELMNDLAPGHHVVTAEFKDGSVSTQLEVYSKNSKNTDDTSSEASAEYKWINMLVVSVVIGVVLLIALIYTIKKLKEND